MQRSTALLLVALALLGCTGTETDVATQTSRVSATVTTSGQGDAGAALQKVLSERGVDTQSEPPTINAEWKLEEDVSGFVMSIQGDHFAEVDDWLRQLAGEPQISADQNADRPQHQMYRLETVALQCIGESDGVQVVAMGRRR